MELYDLIDRDSPMFDPEFTHYWVSAYQTLDYVSCHNFTNFLIGDPVWIQESLGWQFRQSGYGAELHIGPKQFSDLQSWALLPEGEYLDKCYEAWPWLKRLNYGEQVKVVVDHSVKQGTKFISAIGEKENGDER